jgi:hypothetical protein
MSLKSSKLHLKVWWQFLTQHSSFTKREPIPQHHTQASSPWCVDLMLDEAVIGNLLCFICYYLMYLYSSFFLYAQKLDIFVLILGNFHALEPPDFQVDLMFISFCFCCLYLCTLTSTTLHFLAALQLFIFLALSIITHLKFGVINLSDPIWTAACTCLCDLSFYQNYEANTMLTDQN